MPIPILMPALSPTMKEGKLSKWFKKEGERISPGEVIAEIETDKAAMEVESADSGILGKIIVNTGTSSVKVKQIIGVILEANDKIEDIDAIVGKIMSNQHSAIESVSSAPAAVMASSSIANANKAAHNISMNNDKRIFISPLAKNIAKNNNIDVKSANIKGSGPNGRIIKKDILAYIDTIGNIAKNVPTNNNAAVHMPISNMRRSIARRLLESKQQIPHFYLTIECDVTNLLNFRASMNNSRYLMEFDTRISVNDIVVKAVAMALMRCPEVNSSWAEDVIIMHQTADISIAMAVPDGLITPIVFDASRKSLSNISNSIKTLHQKAKNASLRSEEFEGGSFTITNLGMYGIKEFKAIINPPQSSILAVGASEKKPVVKDGAIVIGDVVHFTLSCDHRVVDGAAAAEFLKIFKAFIENPSLMLM